MFNMDASIPVVRFKIWTRCELTASLMRRNADVQESAPDSSSDYCRKDRAIWRLDDRDFVAALSAGGYLQGQRGAVAAVPEPSSLLLLAIGCLPWLMVRRSNGPF